MCYASQHSELSAWNSQNQLRDISAGNMVNFFSWQVNFQLLALAGRSVGIHSRCSPSSQSIFVILRSQHIQCKFLQYRPQAQNWEHLKGQGRRYCRFVHYKMFMVLAPQDSNLGPLTRQKRVLPMTSIPLTILNIHITLLYSLGKRIWSSADQTKFYMQPPMLVIKSF